MSSHAHTRAMQKQEDKVELVNVKQHDSNSLSSPNCGEKAWGLDGAGTPVLKEIR